MQRTILMLLSAAFAGAAAGQEAQAPHPADPQARVAPPAYRSAFEGYRPFVEAPLAPWRVANDQVERVGGHAGVLRADEQAGKSAAPPRASGHGAHK